MCRAPEVKTVTLPEGDEITKVTVPNPNGGNAVHAEFSGADEIANVIG